MIAEDKIRIEAEVKGRVQGVGYRFYALQAARQLGISGYVRNTASGAVEIVAEGAEQELEQLLLSLHQGPRAARVDDVVFRRVPATGEFDGFDVRF